MDTGLHKECSKVPHSNPPLNHAVPLLSLLVGLLVTAVTFTADLATAQDGSQIVKGSATIALKGRCREDVPRDSAVLQEGLRQAKVAAIRSHTSSYSPAKQKMYAAVASTIEASTDQYLTNVVVVDQRCDTSTKVFHLVIRGTLNTSAFNHLLQQNIPAVGSGEGSMFVAIFLARRAAAVTEYEKKTFRRVDVEHVSNATETIAANDQTMHASEEGSVSTSVSAGGSTTQKADAISYEVERPRDLEDSVNGVLSTAGFEMIDVAEVVMESAGVFDLQRFAQDFGGADDISTETRSMAYGVLRDFEIPLFAMGTLDVGVKDTDPVSGNTRVFVSVAARVYDLSKRFARTIASVGPVQYSGLGPDQTVAERNALILAAEAVASEIVVQLQAKGIQ